MSYGNYGPKKFNSVSFLLLLLAAGIGYWMAYAFPAYWDSWTVEHELKAAAASVYKINNLAEPARTEGLKALLERTKAKVIEIGHDPDTTINLDLADNKVLISAEYTAIVTHPVGNKTTRIFFRRKGDADIKRVKWED